MSDYDSLLALINDNKDLFILPKVVDDGCNVLSEIYKMTRKYLEFFKTHLNSYHTNAKNTVDRLEGSIEAYYRGDIDAANQNIRLILEDTKKLNRKLIIQPISDCFLPEEEKFLFRGRIGDFYEYSIKQMFHIPYDERGKISNQRYSINGMPCLYLGTSVYVCWEELNRPDFNHFWVSRYSINSEHLRVRNLKILNLSYTIQDMNSKFLNSIMRSGDIEESLINYCLCWILQCVCSIVVKNQNRIFREEYVFPQLIMQNIRRQDIDGIMFFSAKCNAENYGIMKNFAFPADDWNCFNLEENFSHKLTKYFSITEPINMGLFNTLIDSAEVRRKFGVSDYCTINTYRSGSKINNIEYCLTNYFNLEKALIKRGLKSLTEHGHENDILEN